MRIKINGLDYVFNLLKNGHKLREELEDDSWDEEDEEEIWEQSLNEEIKESDEEELEKLKKSKIHLNYSEARLINPFDRAIFYAENSSNTAKYNATIVLICLEPWIFKGMSRNLEDIIAKNKKVISGFVRANEDGEGYFLDPEYNPTVATYVVDNETREFKIGNSGAYERKINSMNDFISNIRQLETAVNFFIEASIEPLVSIRRLSTPYDIEIPLNP